MTCRSARSQKRRVSQQAVRARCSGTLQPARFTGPRMQDYPRGKQAASSAVDSAACGGASRHEEPKQPSAAIGGGCREGLAMKDVPLAQLCSKDYIRTV